MDPGERIFTAWMTSTDGLDHAVTDEEFHDHRPEPQAVCGAVILLAPMEASPGPYCPGCLAFLDAGAAVVSPPPQARASRLWRALLRGRAGIENARSVRDSGVESVSVGAVPEFASPQVPEVARLGLGTS